MYYAKSTGGFYVKEIHGKIIPNDAVEITDEEHQALLDGQSQGKAIVADADGRPMLQDPSPPTAKQIILSQIAALEATVTPRRLREAILAVDKGWLASIDASIDGLRKQLP